MALVIDLKPSEKILIGQAVITNGTQRARLHIAGETPILREKDVLKEDEADSPCKQIYFLVQCMYLANDTGLYHEPYFKLIRDIQKASPSLALLIFEMNALIIDGAYYKALKIAKQLITLETELIDNALKQVNQ